MRLKSRDLYCGPALSTESGEKQGRMKLTPKKEVFVAERYRQNKDIQTDYCCADKFTFILVIL